MKQNNTLLMVFVWSLANAPSPILTRPLEGMECQAANDLVTCGLPLTVAVPLRCRQGTELTAWKALSEMKLEKITQDRLFPWELIRGTWSTSGSSKVLTLKRPGNSEVTRIAAAVRLFACSVKVARFLPPLHFFMLCLQTACLVLSESLSQGQTFVSPLPVPCAQNSWSWRWILKAAG